jgi:hypothetical protein
MAEIMPPFRPMSALTMPHVIDDQRVGDHRIGHIPRQALALTHAVADHLAAAELHLFAGIV